MERIVAVRPEAGFLSVDVDTGVAHGAVEDEGCFLAGRKCRGFKVQAIPAYTDKGKSARASCVFQCFLLPVLGDSDFLFVIFDTERTVDSPVVRDGDGLPFGVVVRLLTEVLAVFSCKLPAFFKSLFRTHLREG